LLDEEIEKESFDVLNETMIRELIPKLGKRALFMHKYDEYKKVAEEPPVQQLATNNIVSAVKLKFIPQNLILNIIER
jgi:hypothetical protein